MLRQVALRIIKEKDIMRRLFSILLAEVLYLVAIVCRWCIVITHFIAYLYTGFFVFMLFLHFTGIARVLDHYTSRSTLSV